jgi:ATP-dependent DNA ligase
VARIIALNVKRAVWTRPELRAEIGYRGFRTASELRHALFKGLRGDELQRRATRLPEPAGVIFTCKTVLTFSEADPSYTGGRWGPAH